MIAFRVSLVMSGFALSTAIFCQTAMAEKPAWRDWATGDRFGIELGAYNANSNTDLRADIEGYNGIGLFINMEDVMDVEEDTWVPYLYAFWRFSERNKIRYAYFDLDRDGISNIDGPRLGVMLRF